MTSVSRTGDPAPGARPDRHATDPAALREQVELARARLGDTIEELAARTDVKALARRRTAAVRRRLTRTKRRAGHPRRSRWVTAAGGTAAVLGAAGAAAAAAGRHRQAEARRPWHGVGRSWR